MNTFTADRDSSGWTAALLPRVPCTVLAVFALSAWGCGGEPGDTTAGDDGPARTGTSPTQTTETSLGETSSSSSPSSDGSSAGGSSSESGISTTTGGSACPVDPRSTCTATVDCSFAAFHCGEVVSWWDAQGCLRPACGGEGECPRGSTCWRSWECDECLPPITNCYDNEAGECACSGDGVCSSAVCVPDDLLATAACHD